MAPLRVSKFNIILTLKNLFKWLNCSPWSEVWAEAVLTGEEHAEHDHEDQHGDTKIEGAVQEYLDVHFIWYKNRVLIFFRLVIYNRCSCWHTKIRSIFVRLHRNPFAKQHLLLVWLPCLLLCSITGAYLHIWAVTLWLSVG